MNLKMDDYFARLQEALSFLDEGTRAEVISELKGHVEEMVTRHPEKSIEDVLAGFGTPEEVADKYRAEFDEEQKRGEPEEKIVEELRRILGTSLPQGLAALKQLGELKSLKELKNLKDVKDVRELLERKEIEHLKEDLADLGKTLGKDLGQVGRDLGKVGRDIGREFGKKSEEASRGFSERPGEKVKDGFEEGLSGLGAQLRGFIGSLVRGASDSEEQATVTVDLEANDLTAVTVDLSLGDVEVRRSADEKVHLCYRLGGGEAPERVELVIKAGELVLNERRLMGNGHRSFVQDLAIEVPHAVALDVNTRTGDVEVEGVDGAKRLRSQSGDVSVAKGEGDVDVKVSSGDIEVSQIGGDVKVATISGDVDVEHVRGRVEASSSSGDITVQDLEGYAELKSISGDVAAGLVGAFEGLVAESKSGDVDVTLPEVAGAELEARSFHGDISLRIAGERTSREGGTLQRTLGQGGPSLRAASMSGDVSVRVG